MRKQLLLLCALGMAGIANAQTVERSVHSAAGNSFSNPSFQVDYSVGEAVTAYGSSGTFTVSQGFQQNSSNGSGIATKTLAVAYGVYPNPANDHVVLQLNTQESIHLRLSMTSVSGRTAFADDREEKVSGVYTRNISLSGLASGVYFLNLFTGETLVQSIRIVKQ